MIVWVIYGNEIGPNGNGAAYFAKKRDADAARRDYNNAPGDHSGCEEPERLQIETREQLARALNDAMGFGCS